MSNLSMDLPKKKRCTVCRKMFRPDSRVKDRQRACSQESCQRQRRSETQARWRALNPEYRNSSRLTKRSVVAQAAEQDDLDESGNTVRAPTPLSVPPLLRSIPWDFAQAELGVGGCDVLAVLAVLLARWVKDQIEAEKSLFMHTYRAVGEGARKDE